jgi:hypothetical protein
MPSDCNFVDYKDRATAAWKNDENIDIPNSTLEHAVFLSNLLFSKVNKSVRIVTGSLNKAFYNEKLLEIFQKLIDKNVSIRIVVWNKLEDRTFLDLLNQSLKGKVEVKNINSDVAVSHFSVIDGKAYRFEDKHPIGSAYQVDSHAKGTVNFNNPKFACILEDLFDNKLWLPFSRLPNLNA